MILLRGRGLLFVKTHKVGGTSVEVWLSRHLEPGDVATPISPEDEALRSDTLAPLGWRTPLREYGVAELAHLVRHRRPAARLRNHSSIRRIRRVLGDDVVGRLHTWTIERNPWDRLVSRFHWDNPMALDRGATRRDFDRWLRALPPQLVSNSHLYFTPDDRLDVDQVLRYEDLDAELAALSARFDLGPVDLPRAKAGYRPPDEPVTTLLSPAAADHIAFACAREIDLLDYAAPELAL